MIGVVMKQARVITKGKMTGSEYRILHQWVERRLGKPLKCSNCGDDSDRRYAWANKSGQYLKTTDDWARLCYPCHGQLDTKLLEESSSWRREYCKYGHRQVLTNLYHNRGKHALECRECRSLRRDKGFTKPGEEK